MPCVNHPHLAEATTCAKCGNALCADCVVTIEGQHLCADCKNLLVRMVERGERLDSLERGPAPWEESPSLTSLFKTARQALLEPSAFFSHLRLQGERHWSYLIAVGWPFGVLAVLAELLLTTVLGTAFAGSLPGLAEAVGAGVTAAISVVIVPLQLLLSAAIGGAIVHLCLRVLGAGSGKLQATFRVYCFAGSVAVMTWVPVVGAVVGGIWSLVITIIGLKWVHDTTYGRVILAVFLPAIVAVVLVLVVLIPVLILRGI